MKQYCKTWVEFVAFNGLKTDAVDAAAAQLLKFAQRVDTTRCGEPSALLVITAGGYGYRRPDGVTVVPIGVLGP